MPAPATPVGSVVCLDVGSTYTKAAWVDTDSGALLATASRPTTVATDVMDGVRACVAALGPGAAAVELRACSSAGGGLRVAVVGNEQLVTAEAGRRVALSSGGHVVAVHAGGLDEAGLESLRGAAPDVVLLVGGTDGGNAEAILADGARLAGWAGPVVVAGNAEATPEVLATLAGAGTPCVGAGNVMPRIGVLEPEPARAAIREMFLSHVIGGKHLSVDEDFLRLVRGATPDVVLRAVELLAGGPPGADGVGGLVLVDVGGATTDVYSAVVPEAQDEELSRDVLGSSPVTRTVEGDLGVRWSAGGTVAAAVDAGWVDDPEVAAAAAGLRHGDPSLVSTDEAGRAADVRLAAWALGVALRRHAGRARVRYEATGPSRGRWVERAGVDLREVGLVICSGGVLRHAVRRDPGLVPRFVAHLDAEGGWQLPRAPRVVVDTDYVLAAAGLLADDHPEAAWSLLAPLRAPGPPPHV